MPAGEMAKLALSLVFVTWVRLCPPLPLPLSVPALLPPAHPLFQESNDEMRRGGGGGSQKGRVNDELQCGVLDEMEEIGQPSGPAENWGEQGRECGTA